MSVTRGGRAFRCYTLPQASALRQRGIRFNPSRIAVKMEKAPKKTKQRRLSQTIHQQKNPADMKQPTTPLNIKRGMREVSHTLKKTDSKK